MRVTSLVENTTGCGLETRHGLSLYIETERHKLLFDLGPDGALLENSRTLGVDLAAVDTVIISHGHDDHGGALGLFLERNRTARVYVQRQAFEAHFSRLPGQENRIGLDPALAGHPQVTLLDGDFEIDEELALFTVRETGRCHSPANDMLYGPRGQDDFGHEQDLLIRCGGGPVLVLGCGHAGIVNILARSPEKPAACIGGLHLFNPLTGETAPEALLDEIAEHLRRSEAVFYTCHCTGSAAFEGLARRMPGSMRYLACGGQVALP